MAVKLGTTGINKVYLGANEMNKVYLGSTEVYSSAPPAPNDAFELTVETTAANESFLLPMQSVTSIDVDWGDGTVDTGITTNNPTHTYATAGTHAISVTGTAGTVNFRGTASNSKLRTVTNLGSLGWTSLVDAFFGTSISSFAVGDCDTSSVNSFARMFQACSSLTTVDFSGVDTSSVTSLENLFVVCSSLNQLSGIEDFNTSNVTSMLNVFNGCSSLTSSLDVSNFDTSNVNKLANMFNNCSGLTDIIGVENFNIEALNSTDDLNNFMTGVTLPTSRYDALLINWDAQEPFDGMSPNFGNSQYTAGGAAEAARTSLVTGDGWTITDGGSV